MYLHTYRSMNTVNFKLKNQLIRNRINPFFLFVGPLTKTLVDFWRLVWEERPPIVVMVTNLKEDKKNKCQQYWPQSGSQSYGPFLVTLTDQQVYTDYIIRNLQIEVRQILHHISVLIYNLHCTNQFPYVQSIFTNHFTL